LHILSGAESLVILSENTGYYNLSIRPLRRGIYQGVIAFVGREPEMYVCIYFTDLFRLYTVACWSLGHMTSVLLQVG